MHKSRWSSAVYSWQTNRQTDTLITILRTPSGGEVLMNLGYVLTSTEQPIMDSRSAALTMIWKRFIGFWVRSNISVTPPLKSSIASLLEPPFRFSYEPFILSHDKSPLAWLCDIKLRSTYCILLYSLFLAISRSGTNLRYLNYTKMFDWLTDWLTEWMIHWFSPFPLSYHPFLLPFPRFSFPLFLPSHECHMCVVLQQLSDQSINHSAYLRKRANWPSR